MLAYESRRVCEMERRRTLLLVDLHLNVIVDTHDDQVAEDVQPADSVENIGIFERHLLGHLHHTQDDHYVGSRGNMSSQYRYQLEERATHGARGCVASHTVRRRDAWRVHTFED